jgi:hypothetical protein
MDEAVVLNNGVACGLELEVDGVLVVVNSHVHSALIVGNDLVGEVSGSGGSDHPSTAEALLLLR